MYQITPENLPNLRIGDIITRDGAKWTIVADPEERDADEIIVTTKPHSQIDIDNGWCGFTLGTERHDLLEFFVLSIEEEPEYFL